MSSVIIQTRKSACSYNEKASHSVGWGGMIPESAIEDYPNLACDPSSSEFALAVESFQEDMYGTGSHVDGKLGRGTWSSMLKEYDTIEEDESYWSVNDRRIAISLDDDVSIVNFDQHGGLDLHRFGHFSSRKGRKPNLIVVHWGGLDPHHCFRIFSSPNREVSSHAGIGLSPNGDATIYQYLDLNHKSWHAGWANSYSVGIDICQQPELKWKDHYIKKGYNLSEMDNNTGRGAKRVLTLDNLPQPYFTAEKKRLIVDYFVKWRITNDEQFYITTSGGQLSALRALLTQRADEGLRNQFGTRSVQEVVSGERDELMANLTTNLNQTVGDELGIEVIDVRAYQ